MERNIKSDFAILDVQAGKNALAKHFKKAPRLGVCPQELRIPIVVYGYLDGVFGDDDGTSREFTMHVEKVQVA